MVRLYVLTYEVVDGYVERRQAWRETHLALARKWAARGQLLLGGALDDPVDRALLVFRVEDASTIELFVRDDPYVQNGLVRAWSIRSWNAVVGAALPG
ncbi:MAG: YciI-like protein [Pirellula sp.]|jgi:uncharacterized protein YciI